MRSPVLAAVSVSLAAVGLIVVGLAAVPAHAQLQQAGVSAAVRGQVALARASQNIVGRQVQSGEPIYLGDAITSGKASGLQIMLLDETVFSIGPNSEISIDEFVYDPETSAGKVTASVAKGVFRFITGRIARKRPEDMTVRLPTATIGIRGTIVAGVVRSGPGDAALDKVFRELGGVAAGVENARDFVVLLGPGSENNTNDRGGAFVYTPRGPQKAMRGRSAGAQLAQLLGFGGGGPGVTVSRTGFGVASGPGGQIFGPFAAPPGVTQGFTNSLGAQPASGAKGKPSDGNAKAASTTPPSDAGALSGETIAQAAGLAGDTATLASASSTTDDVGSPASNSAGAASAISIDDLIAAQGSASSISTGFINVNQNSVAYTYDMLVSFSSRILQFQYQNIQINGVHDFGKLNGSVNFDNLPDGLVSYNNSVASISTTPGSDGDCNACTVSGFMPDTNNVNFGLTFNNGGASVGGDFNGNTASGTASVAP